MSLALVGTPNLNNGNTVTIPTHAIGDIIVIYAYRNTATALPSVPAASGTVPAWVDIQAVAGTATNCNRAAYFVATANNHTSGTWTNANSMIAVVLRGQAASPIGGSAQSTSSSATNANAPAITPSFTDGSSVFIDFHGCRTVTSWNAPPAGYTTQVSSPTTTLMNTKDVTTSDGAVSQSMNTSASGGFAGIQVEIVALAGGSIQNISASLTPTATITASVVKDAVLAPSVNAVSSVTASLVKLANLNPSVNAAASITASIVKTAVIAPVVNAVSTISAVLSGASATIGEGFINSLVNFVRSKGQTRGR